MDFQLEENLFRYKGCSFPNMLAWEAGNLGALLSCMGKIEDLILRKKKPVLEIPDSGKYHICFYNNFTDSKEQLNNLKQQKIIQ